MSMMQRLLEKEREKMHPKGITLAFLGDSVTQGCFELYKNEVGRIRPVFEPTSAYPYLTHARLCALYPEIPFHLINAGESGDRAPGGLARLARDVLSHNPDLTVVCYGLNDCNEEKESVARYAGALDELLRRVRESGSEVIFMTPNMMNTALSPQLYDKDMIAIAEHKRALQVNGVFTAHIEAAVALCRKLGVCVCDCYALWQDMQHSGVNVTELLCNKINHPTRELQKLFAEELVKTLLREEV